MNQPKEKSRWNSAAILGGIGKAIDFGALGLGTLMRSEGGQLVPGDERTKAVQAAAYRS